MTGAAECRLCGSSRARLRVRLDGYSVLRCLDCGAVFSDADPALLARLYDEDYFSKAFAPYFAALFGDADDAPLRAHFERYVDALERRMPAGRLLDIGCAAGLFLDVARGRGWEVEGVEISEHAAAVARERRGLTVAVGDVMDVSLPAPTFDAVTMLDVLEHVADPGALLERVRALLRPGGLLMLVLPNDRNLTTMAAMALHRASFGLVSYPASRVHQIYHLTNFAPRTISRLLSEHGFEVVDVAPDETVRELLNESGPVKAGVATLFAVARLLGLQNKMTVIARAL